MNDFDPDMPHSCRCGRRWDKLKTCHCCVCHRTFTAITGFDRHRRNGKCLDPATVGLVDANRTYSCWGWPGRNTTFDGRRKASPTSILT